MNLQNIRHLTIFLKKMYLFTWETEKAQQRGTESRADSALNEEPNVGLYLSILKS